MMSYVLCTKDVVVIQTPDDAITTFYRGFNEDFPRVFNLLQPILDSLSQPGSFLMIHAEGDVSERFSRLPFILR